MEKVGSDVLLGNIERLKASSVDPARFAGKLQEADIITKDEEETGSTDTFSASEQWGYLLSLVIKNSADGVFQKFINVLLTDSEKELKELGKDMKGT